jgi:hypothetical protein
MVYARADGSEKRRLAVYFRPEVYRSLRVTAAEQDLDASTLVDRLLASVMGVEGPELLERVRTAVDRRPRG